MSSKHSVYEQDVVSAGDGVFFDHYNLHRTGFGVRDTNFGYAVESWFIASSLAPDKPPRLLF